MGWFKSLLRAITCKSKCSGEVGVNSRPSITPANVSDCPPQPVDTTAGKNSLVACPAHEG